MWKRVGLGPVVAVMRKGRGEATVSASPSRRDHQPRSNPADTATTSTVGPSQRDPESGGAVWLIGSYPFPGQARGLARSAP